MNPEVKLHDLNLEVSILSELPNLQGEDMIIVPEPFNPWNF